MLPSSIDLCSTWPEKKLFLAYKTFTINFPLKKKQRMSKSASDRVDVLAIASSCNLSFVYLQGGGQESVQFNLFSLNFFWTLLRHLTVKKNKQKVSLKKLKGISKMLTKPNISFNKCLLVCLSVTLQMPYKELPGNLYSIHPHFSN